MNIEEKTIDGLLIRRSKRWPNYGCTTSGEVFRWDREKRMTPCISNAGYMVVRVCHNNKAMNAHVHYMVADCWLENDDPEHKIEVNHKDGDKTNPNLENVEWSTKSQNQRHAIETGLKSSGESLYNAQLTHDQVHLVCRMLEDGVSVSTIAEKFEVSKDIVSKIRSGDSYPHIRRFYDINHKFKNSLSESTVRWICEQIIRGLGDSSIAKESNNKNVNVYEVKRIRNKIRYKTISNEYF